jgi:hypothetical protein
VTDGFDADDAPGALAALTGYERWDRTRRAEQQVTTAYERAIGSRSPRARAAAVPEFLRAVRHLLALRLVAVAGDRRRAFPPVVPPAGNHGIAALWAEVFWAARARSPDDDSGVLEVADAAIRGLLSLTPADLADPDTVRAWRKRLELVEETLRGLEMEAQVTLEQLQVTVDHGQRGERS